MDATAAKTTLTTISNALKQTTSASTSSTTSLKGLSSELRRLSTISMTQVPSAIKDIANSSGAIASVKALKSQFQALAAATINSYQASKDFLKASKAYKESVKVIDEAKASLDQFSDGWKLLVGNIDAAKAGLDEMLEEGSQALLGKQADMTAANDALTESIISMKSAVSALIKSVVTLVSKLAILATALGAILQIKNAFNQSEDLDAIDETSQKVMMTTSAYQKWCYVLQMTGASTSTLKTAMRGLNSAVKSGSDAFAELGISASEAANMDRGELFEETIKRIQNLETAEKKAEVASELFGTRAFSDLMPLLNQTNGDLQSLIKTYDVLGVEMGSNYTSAAAKLQDSIDLLKYSFEGLRNVLAVKIIPVLQKVVEWLTVAVTCISYFFKALLGIENVNDDSATDTADDATESWGAATDAVNAYKRSIMGFDELNTLNDNDSGSSSSSISVDMSDFDTSGLSQLAVLSDTAIAKIEKFKAAIDKMKGTLQTLVPAVLGVIGAVMVIAGLASSNPALLIAGISMLGVGATIASANGTLDFSGIKDSVREGLQGVGGVISEIAGWTMIGLGIMFCAASMIPVGLGFMALGAAAVVAPIAANWDTITGFIEDNLGTIELAASGAALALGAILCLSGVMIPVGIALLALGAANLVTQVAPNWDSIPSSIQQAVGVIGMALGAVAFVVGAILCFSGVGIGVGLGLMVGGAAAFYGGSKALNIDWNAIGKKLGEALENAKQTVTTKLAELKAKFENWKANLKTPHISWVSDGVQTTGLVKKALEALNIPTTLPKLSVSWYAKGGITNGTSLLGVGEKGAEAILPLDNNTEWMDKLADRLASKIGGNQDVAVNVDGKQLFDIVVARNNQTVNRTGKSPLYV